MSRCGGATVAKGDLAQPVHSIGFMGVALPHFPFGLTTGPLRTLDLWLLCTILGKDDGKKESMRQRILDSDLPLNPDGVCMHG